MEKTRRSFLHTLLAASVLSLCLFLASCSTPGSRTIPVKLTNQSGHNASAWLVVGDDSSSTFLLNGYGISETAQAEVPVSINNFHSPMYIYLKDNTAGQHNFFTSIEVPSEIGEYVSLTLRLEGEQLVLDVDWGNGNAVTLRPVTDADSKYDEFCRWYNWKAVTYSEVSGDSFWLTMLGYNEAKWIHVYGDSQSGYGSKSEASSHMVKITFPIWKLSGSKKVSSTASIWINSAVADDVVAIFTEIYNDPEQFPINSVGGYSWRGDTSTSQHNPGLAIDINPNENYQIRYGKVVTGSFWDPAQSVYSISETSSVVRIFRAHGWDWGGDAWAGYTTPSTTGNHDYMHFSYFGT